MRIDNRGIDVPSQEITSSAEPLSGLFRFAGDLGLFGLRAIREAFLPPYEIGETARQVFEAGWKSTPLIIASGFAFGVVLVLVVSKHQ